MKLVCFSHPKYQGFDSPVLSCKTCCGIYVAKIKEDNVAEAKKGTVDVRASKYMPRRNAKPVFHDALKS